MTVIERFLAKTEQAEGGCWIWTASVSVGSGRGQGGYGFFHLGGKNQMAHRVSYELFVGPIPEGLEIDHLCGERRCVNPEHLEAVTGRTNTLRSSAPSAVNAQKTHCPRDHPYIGENLFVDKQGRRHCRECRRIRSRDWWRANPDYQRPSARS